MNQRNKPKLAVIIPTQKPLDRWYLWDSGLVGALRILSEKFNVRIFGFSNVPAYIPRNNFVIQLFDNDTSMRYWLKSFAPKYVIGYGKYDGSWGALLNNKYLGLETKSFVLGLNTEEESLFSTHDTFFATDTELYRPTQANKFYPCIFTLPLDNLEKIVEGSLCLVSDGIDFQEVLKNKYSVLTAPKTPLLLNQTLGVITNDVETALDAMACNVPVLTTDVDIEGCWRCPKDEIDDAYLQMVLSFYGSERKKVNLRKDYIIGKADHKTLAERIREICR